MGKLSPFFTGAAVGAGLMYLCDPSQGARRRALLRDRWTRLAGSSVVSEHAAAVPLRRLATQLRDRLTSERTPDDVLAARVRSNLGRIAPEASIDVMVRAGRVTLRGAVPVSLVARVLDSTRLVRGVTSVDDQLNPSASPDNLPQSRGASAARAS